MRWKSVAGIIGIVGMGAAVAMAGPAPQAAAGLSVGTTFKIQLQTKLDTKKAKVGDKVIAKVSDNVKDHDATVLAKGSLLTGTITQVTPAQGDQPAELGVLFNQAGPKQGPAITLRAAITKVYADNGPNAGMVSTPTEMGGSGVNMPLDAGNPAYARMDRSSNGVPIQYAIQESAAGQESDLGGVISSVHGNFSLDDGAHMQVRVLQSDAAAH